eukprot:534653-Ditylum_brightwellii.AAC.1
MMTQMKRYPLRKGEEPNKGLPKWNKRKLSRNTKNTKEALLLDKKKNGIERRQPVKRQLLIHGSSVKE